MCRKQSPPSTGLQDLHPALRWLAAGSIVLLLAVTSQTTADPDLWGHLRFGLDLLQTHYLTTVDPYSFTQDLPWLNHEWASELQMALVFAAGGVAGLALLKAALVSGAAMIVWSGLRGTDFAPRVIVLGVWTVGTGAITPTLRPQLWSLVCFAILCRALATDEPRVRRALPILFVVWANVHGAWFIGAGILGLWAIVDAVRRQPSARELMVIVIVCAVSTLCTPYSWTLWEFTWRILGMSREITELQPLWGTADMVWLAWLAAAGAVAGSARQADSHRWHRLTVLAILAFASLMVSRFTPFFVTGAAVLLAPWLRGRWPDRVVLATPPHERVLAASAWIGLLAASAWVASSSLRCIPVSGYWVPDRQAARVLDSAPPGRLVVHFDWGDYAIWQWGPRVRVSMDGRREVHSDRALAESAGIRDGTPEGFEALARWKAEYVWLGSTSLKTRQWLTGHGYRIEHETARSFIAVRADLPLLQAAGEGPVGARCFPE